MAGRVGVVLVAVVSVVVGLGGPASAHVEVSADKAQAGAGDVTVTFSAESESRTAGIAALRIVLPAGIAPADVTWVSGPAGWALTVAADGYTVAGPALPAGQDAKHAVKIATLPAGVTTLAFKTLQTYSDGRIDRWIDIPESGAAEPDHPAPTLKLQPAAAPATSAATSPTPATTQPTTEPATTTSTASTAAVAKDSGSSSVLPWVAVPVVVIVAVAGGLWWARRRTTPRDGGAA